MKFILKVNETAIISQLIHYKLLSPPLLTLLQEKFAEEICMLAKQPAVFNEQLAPHLFAFCKQQPEIRMHIQKCTENAQRIEQNLQKHQPSLDKFVHRLAKTELPFANTINVYIVPCGGWYMPDEKAILWGHEKGYENASYDLVYLNHERMHSVIKNTDISHVVIECFDKEISEKVFGNDIHFIKQHSYLQNLHYKILPFWNLYTQKTVRDIKQQNKQKNFSYAVEELEPLRDTLSAMNVYEFISFLENKHVDQIPLKKEHILQPTNIQPGMFPYKKQNNQAHTQHENYAFALQYTINEPYLLASILKTQSLPVPLLNALWLHHESEYRAVLNAPLEKVPQDLALFTEMQQAEEVNAIIENCQNYAKDLQNAFANVEQNIQTYLANVLKYTSSNTNHHIFVGNMPATFYTQGISMVDANHKQDMALVVAQSVAQCLLQGDKQSKIKHAFCDILTNELYHTFTNRYIEEYGSDELEELRLKILPWWNVYAQKSEKDVESICSCYHVTYPEKAFAKYTNAFANMNFDDFLTFLESNATNATNVSTKVQIPANALSAFCNENQKK